MRAIVAAGEGREGLHDFADLAEDVEIVAVVEGAHAGAESVRCVGGRRAGKDAASKK